MLKFLEKIILSYPSSPTMADAFKETVSEQPDQANAQDVRKTVLNDDERRALAILDCETAQIQVWARSSGLICSTGCVADKSNPAKIIPYLDISNDGRGASTSSYYSFRCGHGTSRWVRFERSEQSGHDAVGYSVDSSNNFYFAGHGIGQWSRIHGRDPEFVSNMQNLDMIKAQLKDCTPKPGDKTEKVLRNPA
jgi:hypothetical protein